MSGSSWGVGSGLGSGSRAEGAEQSGLAEIAALAQLDPSDDQAIAELVQLYNAAEAADEPWQPGWTPGQMNGSTRHGWDGEPSPRWLLRDDGSVSLGAAVAGSASSGTAAAGSGSAAPNSTATGSTSEAGTGSTDGSPASSHPAGVSAANSGSATAGSTATIPASVTPAGTSPTDGSTASFHSAGASAAGFGPAAASSTSTGSSGTSPANSGTSAAGADASGAGSAARDSATTGAAGAGSSGTGRLIGELRISRPMRDNLHLAGIGVLIHPEYRRQGHGRRLFEYGLRIVRESGRRVIATGTVDAPGPNAFAERLGFTKGGVDIQRRQDLTTLDRGLVDALYKEAAEAAAGYEMLKIIGPTPEHLIDAVAIMTAAINDAPTDDMDVEDHVYDAERIRAFDRAQAGWGNRVYRLIARRRSDGALAGHTLVGVHPEQAEWGNQYDTSVLKEHRGHKLGLLLKAAMVRWLDETEPQLRAVDTWNAESNTHMIGINERLGYRIVGRYIGWQKDLS